MATETDILGIGWSFPPTFTREAGSVEMRTDVQDINESLAILFSTRQGERVLAPEYGSSMERLLFDPMDTGLRTFMRTLISEGITRFEPRIELNDVQLEADNLNGIVRIMVDYTIPGTTKSTNFVYPFYLNQGSNA